MQKNDINFSSASQSQHYETRLGSFDQIQASQDKIQPHWQDFITTLDNMGGAELDIRRQEIQRLLRENGVTYTVYNEKDHFNHLWKLDPIPLLISATEWQVIEQGLIQRAELLNLILKDLYGPQLLLKQRLIPAELIYAHQGFLSPCVGSMTDTTRMNIYAANLARGPSGNMWVLNDHTQAPSGIGYSLENRNITGRVMADLYHSLHIQRLSPFFNTFQQSLAQSAPHNKEEPHIVVLTPGSLNETYFEHSYLASRMGFTLAQGEDLTVRDSKVWLRTLEGLQQVDVIVRRVDDNYCDPLELKNSSKLGIAGLLQAVRAGNVNIANPLGSSILENQGLLAFLPVLCRYFLNQELILPSVASWWCGQKKEQDFVINNLSKLAIKTINRGSSNHIVFGHELNLQQRDDLIQKIKAKPYLFVGQEQITFSTVPSLIDGRIEARNSILRSFAIASDQSYSVMPGGLTRVAIEKTQFTVSNQFGAINKDTWIQSDEKPKKMQPSVANQRSFVSAISEPLTSRAADNLFWVGRHFERIQGTTRLMRTILVRQNNPLNSNDEDSRQCLQVLLQALTHLTASYPGFITQTTLLRSAEKQEIIALFKDQQRNGSIAQSILSFFQSAYNVRDLWSQDTWRCIDAMQFYWKKKIVDIDPPHSQLDRCLTELSTRLAAFSGLTAESMSRESGWLLLQLGRKLERSISIISLLRSTVVSKQPEHLIHSVLEADLSATDSLSLYRRRYRSATRLPMLLDLLLKDKKHPHSLLFQIQHLHKYIAELPGQTHKNQLSREEGLILKAYTDIQLSDTSTLLVDNKDKGIYENLDELLANTVDLLAEIAESITQSYFNHIAETHQLVSTDQGQISEI